MAEKTLKLAPEDAWACDLWAEHQNLELQDQLTFVSVVAPAVRKLLQQEREATSAVVEAAEAYARKWRLPLADTVPLSIAVERAVEELRRARGG